MFLGILRVRGGAVIGGHVAVGHVVDWIGFRVAFSDSVRGPVDLDTWSGVIHPCMVRANHWNFAVLWCCHGKSLMLGTMGRKD